MHTACSLMAGRVLACGGGRGTPAGHGHAERYHSPAPVIAMDAVRVRSVAAGGGHSFAITWDGLVYSWGYNGSGQLGHGDRLTKSTPAVVEGLEGVDQVYAGGCGGARGRARHLRGWSAQRRRDAIGGRLRVGRIVPARRATVAPAGDRRGV
jgi:hypothetical protein